MNAKISVFTIFASFALLFAGCSKDDENIPGGIEPPKTILDAFNAKYPDARDTEWTVNDDYYVIDFENMPVGRLRKPIPSAGPEWEPYIR